MGEHDFDVPDRVVLIHSLGGGSIRYMTAALAKRRLQAVIAGDRERAPAERWVRQTPWQRVLHSFVWSAGRVVAIKPRYRWEVRR